MMRDQKSIEYEIAQRQIVMKDFPDKSMFTHIQCLLDLYDLPSVFELMSNTLPKLEWKNTLNRKIMKWSNSPGNQILQLSLLQST